MARGRGIKVALDKSLVCFYRPVHLLETGVTAWTCMTVLTVFPFPWRACEGPELLIA